MTDAPSFLNRSSEELEGFLLELARRERAPVSVRERTLTRVATVSTALGVAALTKASAAAAGQAGTTWLAAKWFAIGLGTALGALGIVDQLQRRGRPEPSFQPAPALSPSPPRSAVSRSAPPTPIASVEPSFTEPPRARPPALPSSSSEIEVQGPHEASGSFEAPSMEQLSRELAALKAARSALARGKAMQAQLALNRYRAEFPAGVLAMEAAALEVETAFALGERERAEALAVAFLRDHATSPLAARVRAVSVSAKKP